MQFGGNRTPAAPTVLGKWVTLESCLDAHEWQLLARKVRFSFPFKIAPTANRTNFPRNRIRLKAHRRMWACKVLGLNRTKVFHVKRFYPIGGNFLTELRY
jgi:hypothetical protein